MFDMYHIFKSQRSFKYDTSLIFHRIQYIDSYWQPPASNCEVTAINVFMNSLVLVCKWSIRYEGMQLSQQNYLTKTYLDGSIFLFENSIIMSLWVMVISLGIAKTQMDIEMEF